MKIRDIKKSDYEEQYRHQGIGRKLFKEAEKRAKRMGVVRMDLAVWSFNALAISAYEDYGMTPQRCIYEKLL